MAGVYTGPTKMLTRQLGPPPMDRFVWTQLGKEQKPPVHIVVIDKWGVLGAGGRIRGEHHFHSLSGWWFNGNFFLPDIWDGCINHNQPGYHSPKSSLPMMVHYASWAIYCQPFHLGGQQSIFHFDGPPSVHVPILMLLAIPHSYPLLTIVNHKRSHGLPIKHRRTSCLTPIVGSYPLLFVTGTHHGPSLSTPSVGYDRFFIILQYQTLSYSCY